MRSHYLSAVKHCLKPNARAPYYGPLDAELSVQVKLETKMSPAGHIKHRKSAAIQACEYSLFRRHE